MRETSWRRSRASMLGSPVAALDTGPAYECRARNHVAGAKTSAHGKGIAIDLAGDRSRGPPAHRHRASGGCGRDALPANDAACRVRLVHHRARPRLRPLSRRASPFRHLATRRERALSNLRMTSEPRPWLRVIGAHIRTRAERLHGIITFDRIERRHALSARRQGAPRGRGAVNGRPASSVARGSRRDDGARLSRSGA